MGRYDVELKQRDVEQKNGGRRDKEWNREIQNRRMSNHEGRDPDRVLPKLLWRHRVQIFVATVRPVVNRDMIIGRSAEGTELKIEEYGTEVKLIKYLPTAKWMSHEVR